MEIQKDKFLISFEKIYCQHDSTIKFSIVFFLEFAICTLKWYEHVELDDTQVWIVYMINVFSCQLMPSNMLQKCVKLICAPKIIVHAQKIRNVKFQSNFSELRMYFLEICARKWWLIFFVYLVL